MIDLLMAALAGAALGVLFFAGLNETVRRGLYSRVPAVWFLLSAVGRIGAVLAAFYLVAHDSAADLIACVMGFTVARWGATHAHQS